MPLFLAPVLLHQNASVTLDLPTTRLENAAPVLTKALGEPIVIATPLLNDTLTISVKDVTRAVFMKKIAEVTNATWSKKENFLLLEQTSAQQAAEWEYAQKRKLEQITKAISIAKQSAQKMLAFDASEAKALKRDVELFSKQKPRSTDEFDESYYRRSAQLARRNPYSRFMKRLTTRFTPQMVMPLSTTNRHIVYSTDPTPMQARIPFKFDDLWAQLVEEQAIWSDVMKGTTDQSQVEVDEGLIFYAEGMAGGRTEPASAQIPTMHVSLNTDGYGMNTSCRIKLFDREGKQISEEYVSLAGVSEEDEDALLNMQSEAKQKSSEKPKLSDEAEEYAKYFKGTQTGKKPPIPARVLEQLLNPEKYEPGAQYQLEVIKFLAQGKNIVSHNCSNLFMDLDQLRAFRSPFFREYIDLQEADNWMTLAVRNRLYGRASRIDPKLSGPMVRSDRTKDCDTIEDQASFAAKLPEDEMSGYLVRSMVDAVRPYPLPMYNDQNSLRLYAHMDTNLRKNILSGRPLPLQKFGDKFARELFKSIFWQDYSNWDVDYELFQNKDGSMSKEFEKIQSQIYGGILGESTNMLPNGLSGDMLISGTESNSEILLADPAADSRFQGTRQLDPNQVGQQLFQEKYPAKYPWVNQSYNKFDKNAIRIVSQRSLSFKVAVRKGISKSFSLSEMHITDPKVYTLDTLPEPIKKKIQEGYKQAEESDKYYSASPRQGRKQPPPL